MNSGSFKKVICKLFVYKSYISNIFMYKQDLALNNQQGRYAIKINQPTNEKVEFSLVNTFRILFSEFMPLCS